MNCPTLAEFQALYSVCPTDPKGCPPALLRNYGLFMAALERMSPARRLSLWRLLQGLHVNSFSAYFTAASQDLGFRVGLRRVGAADADMVMSRFYFPADADAEPIFDIYPRTVGRREFGELVGHPLFDGDELSPVARRFADELEAIAPAGKVVADFLDKEKPYVATLAKQMLAHRLPVSHPVGGLKAASDAERFRNQWKQSH